MLVFDTKWQTWHSLVRKQTCYSSHQMDKRLCQMHRSFGFLHSFIRHVIADDIVLSVMQLNIANWIHFKTQIFQDTEDPKINLWVILVYLRKANIRSHKLMCKKQTSVSQSSTESKIMSLDAGLTMDGIPAFDLWGMVIDVLQSLTINNPRSRKFLESGTDAGTRISECWTIVKSR